MFRQLFNPLLVLTLLLALQAQAEAQGFYALREGRDTTISGFRLRYDIINARPTTHKGADFERYEVQVSLVNTDHPFFFILERTGPDESLENQKLAEFTCTNAAGLRLTSQTTTLNLPLLRTTVNLENDELISNLAIGYGMQRGEVLTNRIVLIVPENEKPRIKAAIFPPPN